MSPTRILWSPHAADAGHRNVTDWSDAATMSAVEQRIDAWLAGFAAVTPNVLGAERVADDVVRWIVRLAGEDKDVTSVWLTLGQRTLRYETYVMPAPEEQADRLYEQLLRRNERLVGAHFSIGVEDAVFLRGELPVAAITDAELDRIVGTLFATVEQSFRELLRVGFASRFPDPGGGH
ncbi:hypothetical protein BH24ACT5_BH24ACT5_10890 [soil metagenome]